MKIKAFEFNFFGENTYLMWDPASGEAAIVDPGMVGPGEDAVIEMFLDENHLTLKYILLTHAHIDHTFGIDGLKERHPSLEVYGHKADVPLGQMRPQQAKMFHLPVELGPATIDRFLDHGHTLALGSEAIEVIATPGHSQGGVCFYVPESGFVVTGDTLFRGSIGRTDLPGGNHSTLIQSIRTRLLTLPPATVVYPGHGPSSTIAAEARSNPYL